LKYVFVLIQRIFGLIIFGCSKTVREELFTHIFLNFDQISRLKYPLFSICKI